MATTSATDQFVERRRADGQSPLGVERRQFGDSRDHVSDEVRELADAIDAYKVKQMRRYLTLEEVLSVVLSLGYTRQTESAD